MKSDARRDGKAARQHPVKVQVWRDVEHAHLGLREPTSQASAAITDDPKPGARTTRRAHFHAQIHLRANAAHHVSVPSPFGGRTALVPRSEKQLLRFGRRALALATSSLSGSGGTPAQTRR